MGLGCIPTAHQWSTVLLMSLSFLTFVLTIRSDLRPSTCVPIEIPMCKGIGYNLTYIPNDLNHTSQEEAGLEVNQFFPLVEINCSEDLRMFLCSMYAPICLPSWPNRVPACRSLCVSARDGCTPVMSQYGFKWPDRMRCEKLPEDNACLRKINIPILLNLSYLIYPNKCNCYCRPPLIVDPRDHYNKVITGNVSNCLMNCRSPYFADFDKRFPSFWLGIWACLCIVSTLITICTFCIDKSRFQYPERPIIFLSLCYFLMAVGYLIRVVVGHEAIACKNDTIRYGSSGAVLCSVVFLFIYFFGMASSLWWVVLTVTWFLAAGLKWGTEAIAKYDDIYHFFVWFISGIQCIFILIMGYVDGDPIAGICYVGNSNKNHLLLFVILPQSIYILIGTGFLLTRFLFLLKIRRDNKGHLETDKSNKSMLRISVLGIVYSVPAVIGVFCCVYEFIYREIWELSYNCPCRISKLQPEYPIFMLKYFMNLAIGTISGFLIWTPKTLDSWTKTIHNGFYFRNSRNYKIENKNKFKKTSCQQQSLNTESLEHCTNSSYNLNNRPTCSDSETVSITPV